MGYIITTIVLALLGAAFMGVGKSRGAKAQTKDHKSQAAGMILLSWLMFAIVIGSTFFNSLTTVPTRTVAVETWFGKPHDSFGAGMSFRAPWAKQVELSAATQTDDYLGKERADAGADGPAVKVNAYGGSTVYVNVTVRWRIVVAQADELYAEFASGDDTFGNIRKSLVTRHLSVVLNEVYAGYNPLALAEADAAITKNNAANKQAKPATVKIDEERRLAKDAQELLKTRLHGKVEVTEMSIPSVMPDDRTDAAIKDLTAEVARTRVAEQRVATATQEAAANDILNKSAANPQVAQILCLQATERMINAGKGKELSPAWNCIPGGASPVVPVR